MSKILTAIYDEHRLIQEAFYYMLKDIDDIEIISTVNTKELLISFLKEQTVHVLIMNIYVLNTNYLTLIKDITTQFPKISLLVYSINDSEDFIVKIIRSGARGFLDKDSERHDLIEAIYTLRNGFDYYSKSIASLLVKRYVSNADKQHRISEEKIKTLSTRETEILRMWGNGMSNKEIADKLFISIRTVESHKNHIMQKLNLKTTVDMLKFAIRNNIVDL